MRFTDEDLSTDTEVFALLPTRSRFPLVPWARRIRSLWADPNPQSVPTFVTMTEKWSVLWLRWMRFLLTPAKTCRNRTISHSLNFPIGYWRCSFPAVRSSAYVRYSR